MTDTKSVVVRLDSNSQLEWASEEEGVTCDPEFAQTFSTLEDAQKVADTLEGAQVHTLTE